MRKLEITIRQMALVCRRWYSRVRFADAFQYVQTNVAILYLTIL